MPVTGFTCSVMYFLSACATGHEPNRGGIGANRLAQRPELHVADRLCRGARGGRRGQSHGWPDVRQIVEIDDMLIDRVARRRKLRPGQLLQGRIRAAVR